jgi:hypothetical protein
VSVSKSALTITKLPLDVVRDSIFTLVNDLGLIEVVPLDTARYNYDPVTLAPLEMLIEQEAEHQIDTGDITLCLPTRVNATYNISMFSYPVYFIQGIGSSGHHDIRTLMYPTADTTTRIERCQSI